MESGKTFFSYSRDDSEFVKKLAEDLRANGVDIWLDQDDIAVGKNWDDEIQRALVSAQNQLIVLTPSAVSSPNVMNEIMVAVTKKKNIIPIKLKECETPLQIARLQWIDFTTDYEKGFNQLLKTLDTEKTVGISEDRVSTPMEKQKPTREAEPKREERLRQETKAKFPLDKSTSAYDSGMKKSPMKLIAAVGVIVVVLAIIIIVSMGPDENTTSPTQESELVDSEPLENNSNEANITDNYATLNDDIQPAMVVYTQRDANGNAIHQNIFNRFEGGITIYVEAEIRAPNSEEELTFKWQDTDGQVLGEKRKPVIQGWDVNTLTGMVEDDQSFNEAGDYLVILYNAKGEEIGRQEFTIEEYQE